jgi:hypothetical protein
VGTLVLHFSDGTASPMFQFNNSDWFFQPNAAIYGFGRLRLTATTAEDDGNSYPELYQTTINLAALGLTNHALVSVEFLDPSTDPRETTGIFAISGSLVPSQAPVVRCKHVLVSAEDNCSAEASVDDGSFDPNAGGTITLVQSPPGPYPLGDTSVTLTAIDNRGRSNSCVAVVTVVDTTAPMIGRADNVVADATSPAGAVVHFTAPAASDNCSLASVTSSPASGSRFAIGTTPVSWTATDAAGNHATCAFSVHVKSAAEQLQDLIAAVHGLGLQRGTAQSLLLKLEDAASDLARGKIEEACGDLHALVNEAEAHKGKKLTVAQADWLAAEITRIRAVLGLDYQNLERKISSEGAH